MHNTVFLGKTVYGIAFPNKSIHSSGPKLKVLLRLQMIWGISLDFYSVFLWFISNMFGFHGMFASCDDFE